MDEDRHRWDERHRGQPLALPAPPEVVAHHPELAGLLPCTGTALDLACGTGPVSLWMADRGLHVTALDVSPVAIDALRRSARAAGDHVAGRLIAHVHDTDDGLPTHVDGHPLTDLSLVVCQRYRATALLPELLGRLGPGGVLVVTVLSAVGLDGPPGPFHAPAGELRDVFADAADGGFTVLAEDEGGGLASVVVRRDR